ncbi:MAG: GNAT family N-acetyltransferase [Bacillota bacterium]|nr:GNAT family N-acetyltransferase [Bacillota bacterium]
MNSQGEVEIRLATPEEAPLVHSVTLDAFAEYRNLPTPSGALSESLEDVEGLMREGVEQAALCLVDGVAVGSVRFLRSKDGLYFKRLAVRPGFRRRGIARAIVGWLEEYARQNGESVVWCNVRAEIQQNVRLYASLGYEAYDERVVVRSDGARVPVVSMRKAVKPGAEARRDSATGWGGALPGRGW